MIPKIVHYCWFGKNEMPPKTKKCIENWKVILSDYKFIEWNEENFDLSCACEYVKDAYEAKKFAFVSDYVRLYALFIMGGIYLDTDVKLIKTFDNFLLKNGFMSIETSESICTAVIGSSKANATIGKIIELYDKRKFILDNGKFDLLPNSSYIFQKFFEDEIDRTKRMAMEDIELYPVDFFCAKDIFNYKLLVTENTVSIHMIDAAWYSGWKKFKRFIKKILIKLNFVR